ncbi:MAG: MOSC domain-containing protein [Flavobacteriales bacterium]|nr:MAG: MOSC domain-containing protein [Flavobacteriales bacterium]
MAHVLGVHLSRTHSFSKKRQERIVLVEGHGVEGDAHAGATVKHRSRVRQDPSQPNLRQVHLVHAELFDELHARGFTVTPGLIGENITTRGLDLLALPKGTLLYIGDAAVVEVTGLRNPCNQLNELQPGLMTAVLDRDESGGLIRKSGIMGVVKHGGEVRPGDALRAVLPALPHEALDRV